MFFKTFAEKQREAKGQKYDRDIRELKAEIERLKKLLRDRTLIESQQRLWSCPATRGELCRGNRGDW